MFFWTIKLKAGIEWTYKMSMKIEITDTIISSVVRIYFYENCSIYNRAIYRTIKKYFLSENRYKITLKSELWMYFLYKNRSRPYTIIFFLLVSKKKEEEKKRIEKGVLCHSRIYSNRFIGEFKKKKCFYSMRDERYFQQIHCLAQVWYYDDFKALMNLCWKYSKRKKSVFIYKWLTRVLKIIFFETMMKFRLLLFSRCL